MIELLVQYALRHGVKHGYRNYVYQYLHIQKLVSSDFALIIQIDCQISILVNHYSLEHNGAQSATLMTRLWS